MSTTLAQELEQAAGELDCKCSAPRNCVRDRLAARLRKRIEHVKRLEAKLQNPSYVDVTQVELDLFATLTGPLP